MVGLLFGLPNNTFFFFKGSSFVSFIVIIFVKYEPGRHIPHRPGQLEDIPPTAG
jgi:hypothetical protein